MATPQVAPQTTEQKVLDSIGEVSAVATSITQRFGHSTAASLIASVPSLAPVFAGLIDMIRGLFQHHKTTTGQ